MKRHVTRIDVGSYDDKAGFTLHFGEEKEHFLFALDIAEDLATKLIKVAKDLRYAKKVLGEVKANLGVPGDVSSVGEDVTVRLTQPKEENASEESA